MVYQDFKKKLVEDFEQRRDIIVVRENRRRPESIFGIKDAKDTLYMKILSEFEQSAIINVENLITSICEDKGIAYHRTSDSLSYCDMVVQVYGVDTYIDFRSQPGMFNSAQKSNLTYRLKELNKPVMMVFLVKDTIESHQALDRFTKSLKEYGKLKQIKTMLFEEFLELLFGREERDKFTFAMRDFKEEMHKVIGYQVTELCSPYNLEKLRKELAQELISYRYDEIKEKRYLDLLAEDNTARDISDRNYEIIKKTFLTNERYKLLLGNSDFAESFITSEWLYKKYVSLDELDNTFIVSGYLKSIEQLLWDIVYIVGQGRKIKDIPISEDNVEEIDKTLGALQYFLSNWYNDDLFQLSFENETRYVMKYLKKQISDWRKQYRNGYFHKHNLCDKNKIEAIREETYFLYLLILGSLKLTPSDIEKLS